MALTDGSGAITERYAHSAYGKPVFCNASGTGISASAEDSRVLYTGREWDEELLLYHFRARLYDPGVGPFISRDPAGYVGGYNLCRSYFVPWGTDASGESRSEAPCIERCSSMQRINRINTGKGGIIVTYPRQQCIDACKQAADQFRLWVIEQQQLGKPDYSNLPNCPCSIGCQRSVFCGFGSVITMTICNPSSDDWDLQIRIGYPFYFDRLHPGAKWDLRSEGGPPRTQCTYDEDGKLITTGTGFGTVDEAILGGGHFPIDVTPVDLIILLEGGRLQEGCWFELYKRYRPLKNGNRCARNPR